jgi:hypothetical protein
MKHLTGQFSIGLALFLISFAGQGLAQSTPQQVKASGWQALTTAGPAVTTGGTNKYIAWMGLNNEVYFAVFNGTSWTDHQIVKGSGWTAETSAAPTLVYVYANDVWLAWKGKSSNDIWFSIWNGTSWSTQQKVSGSSWTAETSSAPSLALFQNTVYLAWQGDASAEDIWYTYYSGEEEWGTQRRVSGSGWTASTSAGPSLNSFPFEENIMYLFWRDKSTGDVWESSGETLPSSYTISWSDGEFSLGLATDVAPASAAFGDDLVVAMGAQLADIMRQWQKETTYSNPQDWVFPSARLHGRKPRTGSVMAQQYLRPAAVKLGILEAEDRCRFGFHNLRHSLASYLVTQTKTDVKTVQTMLRHADVGTTLGLYTHSVNKDKLIAQNQVMEAIMKPGLVN